MSRLRTRRAQLRPAVSAALAAMLPLGAAAGCNGHPSPAGDPDPGGRIMTALAPVLTVIPTGARVTRREKVRPRWDSCDGVDSSYGWDPVTVDAQFTRGNLSWQQVVMRMRAAMASLSWTYDAKDSGGGAWYWTRQIEGTTATAKLLGGPGALPHSWSLDAEGGPAVHPVKGC